VTLRDPTRRKSSRTPDFSHLSSNMRVPTILALIGVIASYLEVDAFQVFGFHNSIRRGIAHTSLHNSGAANLQLRDAFRNPRTAKRALFTTSLKASESSVYDDPSIESCELQTADGPMASFPEEWLQAGVYACFNKQGEMQYVAMSRKVAISIANHLQILPPDECHSVKLKLWEAPTKQDLEGTARAWIEACIDKTGGAPPGNTKEVESWRKKVSEMMRAKPNVEFSKGATEEGAVDEIKKLIGTYPVVLFVKGSRQAPQCGFTEATIALFDQLQVDYECVDCLDEEANPGLRDKLKEFSQWPTIPQAYVGGEFMGGADVCREMAETGELQAVLQAAISKAKQQPANPISFQTIAPKAVQQLIDSESVPFIDCRTPPEWQAGRVKGAVNIPAFLDGPNGRQPVRESFVKAVKEQFPSTETKLVVGCQRAVRSKDACAWLNEEGYNAVYELDGGYAWWVADDSLPVEA